MNLLKPVTFTIRTCTYGMMLYAAFMQRLREVVEEYRFSCVRRPTNQNGRQQIEHCRPPASIIFRMKAVMSELKYVDTLVATLGGQPQVVTFTLDLLLQRGIPISEVIILRPESSDERLQCSLAHLNAEFVGDFYQFGDRPERCRLRSYVLQLDDTPLDDIVDDSSAKGVLDTVHRLVRDLKQQHRRNHLSVTGGRRLMSL